MSFLLFLISVVIIDRLLLRAAPAPKRAPEGDSTPPKSKPASSSGS